MEVKQKYPGISLSELNITRFIRYDVRHPGVFAIHCPGCKDTILKSEHFIGEFKNKIYQIMRCSKCNENFLVISVFVYNFKNKKQNLGGKNE